MELLKRAEEYMRANGIDRLIDKAPAVLVAFSGGADSAVLLRVMNEYLRNKSAVLAAAHLDHMIRGDEAVRDREFCRKAAEKLHIPFYTVSRDVPVYAKKTGMTVEEAARKLRYEFLDDIARKLGENTLIATAHNSTDNLETVIFNLARGSGTVGMGGIAPVRDSRIIRPLLFVSGEEIRTYAKVHSIDFVYDSTNGDTAYTRNFVRHNIVPALKEINPSAEEAVLRLGSISRNEADFINYEAQKLICNSSIKRSDFECAHPALQSAALRLLYKKEKGSADGLSMKNLQLACDFILNGRGYLSFPHLTLLSDSDIICFTRETEREATIITPSDDGIAVPFGENFAIAVTKGEKEPFYDKNIYNLFIKQSVCFDTIYGSIFVRARRAGDRILSGGMHKRLKKLMCDKNVPLRYREHLPLFCDENGLIWIPSVALRDGARGKDATMYVLIKKGQQSYE